MKIFSFINSSLDNNLLFKEIHLAFYLKPETALLKNNTSFFIPEFSTDIRCCMGVAVKICKLGKHIKEKFATNYYNEISICVNIVAYDVLAKLIMCKMPWDKAISFDGSTIVGSFIQCNGDILSKNTDFNITINDNINSTINILELPVAINKAIEAASVFYTFKIGDYLIIEAPYNYFPLKIGDSINGFISGETKIDFKIK